MNLFKRFLRGEQALETVEYAVMTAFIVAALITAFGLVIVAVSRRFTATGTTVAGIG